MKKLVILSLENSGAYEHITPRYFNDDIKFMLNLKNYKETEMKKFADRIRQEIQ